MGPTAAAVLSGVLFCSAFPDWSLWPLAWLAPVPLWWAASRLSIRGAFLVGWLCGWVTNLGGFWWIIHLMMDFGHMPWAAGAGIYALLALQQGLSFGLAAGLGRWATARRPELAWLLWPATLTLADSAWPMIFKWYIGNSQWNQPWIAQLAELGGVPLVTLLVVLPAGLATLHPRWGGAGKRPDLSARSRSGVMAAVVSVVVVAHGWGALRIAQMDARAASAPTLHVGTVEANIGIEEKTERDRFMNNLLIHQRLSADLAARGVALVVWPETAYLADSFLVSTDATGDPAWGRRTAQLSGRLPWDAAWLPPSAAPLVGDWREDVAARTPVESVVPPQRGFRVPLLTGTVMVRPLSAAEQALAPPRRSGALRQASATNSAVLLDENGRILARYDKNILMPFSERLPLGRELWQWFGFNLYAWIPHSGDFWQGSPPELMVLPVGDEGVRLVVLICYEDIMPLFTRQAAAGHPEMLINVTNDAWFGQTSEPWLHLALATFRAIEARTWLVRATNTGVSAFIDASGRVVAHTSLTEEETLDMPVPRLAAGHTLFARVGHHWLWLLAWMVAMLGPRREEGGGKSLTGAPTAVESTPDDRTLRGSS
jgi:apolipoprotein N-acyltransferase